MSLRPPITKVGRPHSSIVTGVVCDAGGGLSLEAMDRLWHESACRVPRPALLQLSESSVLVPVRFGKDQQLNVGRELLRPKPALDVTHVPEYIARIPVASCPRAHQNHTAHQMRMPQRKLLCDCAAHRAAHYSRLFDSNPASSPAWSSAICSLEYGPDGLSLRPTPRLSGMMQRNSCAQCSACFCHTAPARGDSHEEQEGIARAALFVVETDSVTIYERHECLPCNKGLRCTFTQALPPAVTPSGSSIARCPSSSHTIQP